MAWSHLQDDPFPLPFRGAQASAASFVFSVHCRKQAGTSPWGHGTHQGAAAQPQQEHSCRCHGSGALYFQELRSIPP